MSKESCCVSKLFGEYGSIYGSVFMTVCERFSPSYLREIKINIKIGMSNYVDYLFVFKYEFIHMSFRD